MIYKTLGAVVQGIDHLIPNSYPAEEKIRWLSSFDGRIYEEIFLPHDGAPRSFLPYEMGDLGRSMLVPEPYGMELYLAYLENTMDHYNGDTARYNNSLDRLANSYREFAGWYHRNHRPIGKTRRFW